MRAELTEHLHNVSFELEVANFEVLHILKKVTPQEKVTYKDFLIALETIQICLTHIEVILDKSIDELIKA